MITVPLPTISEQPNNMTINVYESVSFKCTANGFGVLKIVWKRVKHNMPVTAEVTEETSLNNITSILKITKIVGYYSGQYYCITESEVGEVISGIANLYVQGNNMLLSMYVYSYYIFVMLNQIATHDQHVNNIVFTFKYLWVGRA